MRKKYTLKSIVVLLLPIVVYFNTLFNEYALDDAIVLTQNSFVKEGFSGIADILTHDTFTGFFGRQKDLVAGGRYRPFSLITFAIEYQFFGENPLVSHLINVFLFASLCLIIFILLAKIFGIEERNRWFTLPFVTTLLFITHPIHTEVVANVKGRDEILALIGSLMALFYAIRFTETKKSGDIFLMSLFYFVGLLSKENSASFIIIIPLIVILFRNPKTIDNVKLAISLLVVSGVFLVIRQSVLGHVNYAPNELMNNPFLGATLSQRIGTISFTLIYYLKLLIFPHPLTYDYYPYHIKLVDAFSIFSLAGMLIYLLIFIAGLISLKKNKIIATSIFIYLLPLFIVSNIIFPVGTFMNERFVFFSSLGFTIFMAYFLLKLNSTIKITILFLLLGLYSFKTVTRNSVWKNDFTLFTTDVKVSKNSAKANTTAGGSYWEWHSKQKPDNQTYLNKSIVHLKRAIDIYPGYTDALLLLGNAMWDKYSEVDSVLFYYEKILNRNPGHANAVKNLKFITQQIDNEPHEKLKILHFQLRFDPDNFDLLYKTGNILGKELGEPEQSLIYLLKAYAADSTNFNLLKDLGVAYGILKEFEKSVEFSKKALNVNSNDPSIWINLGLSYYNLGNPSEAKRCFDKAEQLKKL